MQGVSYKALGASFVLLWAYWAPLAVSELRIVRDVGRPDQFSSTVAANCLDSYCSTKGAVAAGHCLCQCPAIAGTIETRNSTCVAMFNDCKDLVLGSSSTGVTTVYIPQNTSNLVPALPLYQPLSNGAYLPVASSLACSYYQAATYQNGEGDWWPISSLGITTVPFGVSDAGQLQWLIPDSSGLLAGKIIKIQFGCSQRESSNSFHYTYCVAIKVKGLSAAAEGAPLSAAASNPGGPTAAPFSNTIYFVVIVVVSGTLLLLFGIICIACCIRSRKRSRENAEMVVFSVTRPENGPPLSNGHAQANGHGAKPHVSVAAFDRGVGISMHPSVTGDGRTAEHIASAARLSSKKNSETRDQLPFNGSIDSGRGRTLTSRGTNSGGEQSSGSDDNPREREEVSGHHVFDQELQQNLLSFEGARFAHEKHYSPRELFKSHSERLTTVRASIGGTNEGGASNSGYFTAVEGNDADQSENAIASSTKFTSTARQFLTQKRNDDNGRLSRGTSKASRSRSVHIPRGGYPKDGDNVSASNISIDLAHFGMEPSWVSEMRSPRKFTDEHVNRGVNFNADGAIVRHALPGTPQTTLSRMPYASEQCDNTYAEVVDSGQLAHNSQELGTTRQAVSPIYASVTRHPAHVSFTRSVASSIGSPVTVIDDVPEKGETDESDGTSSDASQRPPPPPKRPPPHLSFQSSAATGSENLDNKKEALHGAASRASKASQKKQFRKPKKNISLRS